MQDGSTLYRWVFRNGNGTALAQWLADRGVDPLLPNKVHISPVLLRGHRVFPSVPCLSPQKLRTALSHACEEGNIEGAQWLIERGADATLPDSVCATGSRDVVHAAIMDAWIDVCVL